MTPLWLLVAAIALAAFSGVPGMLLGPGSARGERLAAGAMAAAAGVGGAAAWPVLVHGQTLRFVHPWAIPGGAGVIVLQLDAVAAVFALPILGIALAGSIYGLSYWPQRDHPHNGRKLRLFYGLMTGGMLLVVAAHNAVLFLIGWEIMTLAAYFSITTEDSDPHVRRVGYVYLVATRLGTLCLFAMFALLAATNGGFGRAFDPQPTMPAGIATAVFCLALAGFGLKAGIMPLHVWLPGAHANAPSHVSALLSGVLLKMGIYGLVRVVGLFATPPLWWGATILALGVVSGVMGVVFAIGQHDVKRLLAYHSVENIGIICIGLGVALLGRTAGRPEIVALGLAGALLHVWNHALFKSLLFLAAGAVTQATHTREMDQLGGLLRRMPVTASLFLVAAVAICGLPPLNGFVSELLVYFGLFGAARHITSTAWLMPALAVGGLALIGGLALACFVKAFGTMFLGVARSDHVASARDPAPSMLAPMLVLAAACLLIGIAPALIVPVLDAAVGAWAPNASQPQPIALHAPLLHVSMAAAVMLLLVGVLWWRLGPALHRAARMPRAVTWDCGYAQVSPRMQYNASSFAQMLVGLFRFALRTQIGRSPLRAIFPAASAFRTHVSDVVLDRWVLPAFDATGRLFAWMHWVQRGNVNAYLMYILVTLVVVVWWRS